jgi:polysaccharide biosynthesis protein PelB
LGYRKALSGFIPASIDIFYELGHQWTANLELGYNQEVYENSYLLIGGVQDQIDLVLDNKITQRDLLTIEALGHTYYSQDRHYLSSGFNLFGTLQHKFYLTYPDYTLGAFGHLFHYDRNGSFGGNITTLFPNLVPSQIPDLSDLPLIRRQDYKLLIPPSYREAGAYFSFGDSIQEYSHRWRPYLWASLFYNSITRLSNNVRGGLNGTIFGRDSLLIYLERGSAPSVANAISYKIGARYKIYF